MHSVSSRPMEFLETGTPTRRKRSVSNVDQENETYYYYYDENYEDYYSNYGTLNANGVQEIRESWSTDSQDECIVGTILGLWPSLEDAANATSEDILERVNHAYSNG